MVSLAVLALLLVILLGTVDQTQKVWSRNTAKVSQFQAARVAFDAVQRNLSQATLNTYYSLLLSPKNDPITYYRDSDLHFVSGQAAASKLLGGDATVYPTHAVFFQAPLGYSAEVAAGAVGDAKKYRSLSNLLCAVGYYIKWGPDEDIPDFLKSRTNLVPERKRYRLMEVVQPAESLGVYNSKFWDANSPNQKTSDWIQMALGRLNVYQPAQNSMSPQSCTRVLAENVIALVLLPKLSEGDRKNSKTLDLWDPLESTCRHASLSIL